MDDTFYEAVVMGVSAGGLEALETVLPMLPADYALPVMIVQHRTRANDDLFCRFLDGLCALSVIEAEEKMPAQAGRIYIAPPDYHLQVETDRTLSLSVDPPVNWSRPSVDVLFETAVEAYRDRLVGVVMTGANKDGSMGLARIKRFGGLAVVQDPETAAAPQMPLGAIAAAGPDHVLSLAGIGRLLAGLKGPKPGNP